MSKEVRVRYAPSPTGFLHVGGLRTALYNFLFARKKQGKYILRIEDTDQARIVPGSLENILQTFNDFKLNADEGPYWQDGTQSRGGFGPYSQSQRLDIYKKHAQELIEKKAAYYCFCNPARLEELRKNQEAQKLPPKYDKQCLTLSGPEIEAKLRAGESHVVRLNVPSDQTIRFTDVVHGEIKISSNEVDDQVLLKSDGFPTYHLASVVDDHLMQITHVIRGDEWIPSTPKHILLYSAFGWESPQFAHLPLLLSKTRKKLSKREGDVAVRDLLEQGYLPDALLNFIALLGWNPKTKDEIFSLLDLIEQFSLEKVNKAGAVFDLDKLDWFNSVYIRKMKPEELFAKTLPYLVKAEIPVSMYPTEFVSEILALEKDRLRKLSEIGERVMYFFKDPTYDAKLLIWKKSDKQIIIQNLEKLLELLKTTKPTEDNIKKFISDNEMKTGEVLWPLRVALTGVEASPGPFEIMKAFLVLPNGREIILKRINSAVANLYKI
ncbi:MAG: glutamate--tRNA ligase [Candidatus Doudnabacteria bacterium RIFCSPHIGHO2_01_FULL_45_18]|uniref:Glutamate--tRNA ligase n=1 Tax=Candidatus Doudnabacteria bacterium RIFCSPHIGHO2_01_FULL_45_18 TaxID=1817823 RepID=A0A1F5NRL5_9BACT|nr:MAG: glutamate--tRNA ligase [Candidatus Doudnabacteria bacterium RIFCSPHIGHO2_01_FULL_45_18]